MTLLHFEFGNAITQQAANAVGTLKHSHFVSGTSELLSHSQSSRTRTDDRNTLTSFHTGHLRNNPTFIPRAINDFDFDLLNGHWVGANAHNTGRFARSRAQPTSEFREVVRGVQTLDRIFPVVAINEIVPVGNQVAKWATVVTERNTAVHAATSLAIEFVSIEWFVNLFPVAQAHRHRPMARALAFPFQESSCLTHEPPPSRDSMFLLR